MTEAFLKRHSFSTKIKTQRDGLIFFHLGLSIHDWTRVILSGIWWYIQFSSKGYKRYLKRVCFFACKYWRKAKYTHDRCMCVHIDDRTRQVHNNLMYFVFALDYFLLSLSLLRFFLRQSGRIIYVRVLFFAEYYRYSWTEKKTLTVTKIWWDRHVFLNPIPSIFFVFRNSDIFSWEVYDMTVMLMTTIE